MIYNHRQQNWYCYIKFDVDITLKLSSLQVIEWSICTPPAADLEVTGHLESNLLAVLLPLLFNHEYYKFIIDPNRFAFKMFYSEDLKVCSNICQPAANLSKWTERRCNIFICADILYICPGPADLNTSDNIQCTLWKDLHDALPCRCFAVPKDLSETFISIKEALSAGIPLQLANGIACSSWKSLCKWRKLVFFTQQPQQMYLRAVSPTLSRMFFSALLDP